MIRIAISYPKTKNNNPTEQFDMDYYRERHMALVEINYLPHGLIRWELDIPQIGLGEPPVFAIGYLYFTNLQEVKNAFKQAGSIVLADIINFTNVTPIIVVSEITIMGGSHE